MTDERKEGQQKCDCGQIAEWFIGTASVPACSEHHKQWLLKLKRETLKSGSVEAMRITAAQPEPRGSEALALILAKHEQYKHESNGSVADDIVEEIVRIALAAATAERTPPDQRDYSKNAQLNAAAPDCQPTAEPLCGYICPNDTMVDWKCIALKGHAGPHKYSALELPDRQPAAKEAASILCGAAQILDVIKQEWGESWSEWDQSIRDGISGLQARILSTADRQPASAKLDALPVTSHQEITQQRDREWCLKLAEHDIAAGASYPQGIHIDLTEVEQRGWQLAIEAAARANCDQCGMQGKFWHPADENGWHWHIAGHQDRVQCASLAIRSLRPSPAPLAAQSTESQEPPILSEEGFQAYVKRWQAQNEKYDISNAKEPKK